jgi:hypothetical protein
MGEVLTDGECQADFCFLLTVARLNWTVEGSVFLLLLHFMRLLNMQPKQKVAMRVRRWLASHASVRGRNYGRQLQTVAPTKMLAGMAS